MINYSDFKNQIWITEDKQVRIPLLGESYDNSIDNEMFLEVYSNVRTKKLIFSTENAITIPAGSNHVVVDMSYLDDISADNISIVIGVSGYFSHKYLLKALR